MVRLDMAISGSTNRQCTKASWWDASIPQKNAHPPRRNPIEYSIADHVRKNAAAREWSGWTWQSLVRPTDNAPKHHGGTHRSHRRMPIRLVGIPSNIVSRIMCGRMPPQENGPVGHGSLWFDQQTMHQSIMVGRIDPTEECPSASSESHRI